MAPASRPLGAALLLLAASPAARGDEVELRNGFTLEGEILDDGDDSITLRIEGGKITFPRKLVAAIRREPPPSPPPDAKPADLPPVPPPESAPAGAGAAPTTAGAGAGETAPGTAGVSLEAAGIVPARDEWHLLWAGDRRAGWRRCQSAVGPQRSLFEEETVLLDPAGKPRGTTRVVEEAGPGFAPVSFLVIEDSPGRSFTRIGRVAEGRLRVETFTKGEKEERDLPLPTGLLLPAAARARVLGDPALAAEGWSGPSCDPRTGEFVSLSLGSARREALPWEGRLEEVLVLARTRGGVREEERVALDGRLLAADLADGALAAIRSTRERIEAFRAGASVEATDEDRRARAVLVSPEDGFRIRKPGFAWRFEEADSRDAPVRARVHDPTGLVEVSVESAPVPGDGDPPLPTVGADLLRRLGERATGFEKSEDGIVPFAGGDAYRILGEGVVDGDAVRFLALGLVHGGRVWTLVARAPVGAWPGARPYLERILAGFEWL